MFAVHFQRTCESNRRLRSGSSSQRRVAIRCGKAYNDRLVRQSWATPLRFRPHTNGCGRAGTCPQALKGSKFLAPVAGTEPSLVSADGLARGDAYPSAFTERDDNFLHFGRNAGQEKKALQPRPEGRIALRLKMARRQLRRCSQKAPKWLAFPPPPGSIAGRSWRERSRTR